MLTPKLKIFSDKSYIPKAIECETMLAPFWKEKSSTPNYPWTTRFDRYIEIGRSFFEMTSLEKADLAILPISWHSITGRTLWDKDHKEARNMAIQFAKKAKSAGKPVVVFFTGPRSDQPIPINNVILFSGSLYRSRQKKNQFAPPLWTEDIVEYYLDKKVPIRQKQEYPTVGFCGFVQKTSLNIKVKSILYKSWFFLKSGEFKGTPYEGHSIRNKAINILSNSSRIKTNFILRDNYIFLKEKNKELQQKLRLEYTQNIIDSDYILCCRGSANSSFRLYETLCCGRIPVFIDTDCVLPYDFLVDWKKYCVWITEKEIPYIAEKIAEFHNKLSPQEFIDLQQKCRTFWKEWLSPEGFFANFHHHFHGK